jgi:hypothetical protein
MCNAQAHVCFVPKADIAPDPGLKIRIVRGCVKEHANAPNALGMLRPRRKRPRCRAAEKRDELAPLDVPPENML